MARTVLIVDDEKPIVDVLIFNLRKAGYNTLYAYDGETGLKLALEADPDLILLDVMLPKLDGFSVCRRIRERSQVPILMITAREDEVDMIFGLDIGSDDYIIKPFSMRELLARVKANLRRTSTENPTDDESNGICYFGDLKVDTHRYIAYTRKGPVELTVREYDLLRQLAQKTDRIVSREDLMEKVWGFDYFGDVRTVDVTIRRLREKIEEDPSNPSYIITKRGVGYFFKKNTK